MSALIKEFECLEGLWRIDWLGRITPRGPEGTLTHIAVHLAQLDQNCQDVLSNAALATPHRVEQVPLDVGLIALLPIGSVWRNGVRVMPRKPSARVDVELEESAMRLVRLDEAIELEGQRVPLLPPFRHRVGGRHYGDIAGSWVALATNVLPDGSTQILVIPSVVIFQATMATSSRAVRDLLQGRIDKIVDPNWGWLADDPTTLRIALFKNFRDSEGPALASIKADKVAAKMYQGMRQHLVTSSANHKGPGSPKLHIKLGLPFSNSVRLRVAGKPIAFDLRSGDRNKTVWGFLVTEIDRLEAVLVFSRLIIDRKNDNRKGQNSTSVDLFDAWSTLAKEPAALSEPLQALSSEDEPGRHLEQLALQAAVGFKAIGLQVVDDPKEVQHYRSAKVIRPEGDQHDGPASTADSTGDRGIAPASIDGEPNLEVPITLEHFLRTLELLETQGLHFETLAVSPSGLRHPSSTPTGVSA